ncbi:magnesium and cobalt transport protein CorA [Streptomyces sp. AM 2-1-1]|uniref:magnesium and cobalt transport protein CorA n=1 Tax=Streptomyces sp. AM 2-1-1 TaxID=3028709 RepID=UPI0023B936E7|nr:magnesium and cobalt transport protein CorA [Streptomyces sp. AM 2-1-1]WEH43559.1 magnesium and cobalt transport protein CorA [Streptomyces sp. AM 2-1-1]
MIRSIRRAMSRAVRRKVDLSHPARSPLGSSVVNCVSYEDGVRQPVTGSPAETLDRVRRAGRGFVWLGLHEPGQEEFARVAALFGLHPVAVENAVRGQQRPKVEPYGKGLFAVFRTCGYVHHEHFTATSDIVNTGDLMVFTGDDFVITVRHGSHGSLGPLRETLEADPDRLRRGPGAVLHAVADTVVDAYADVADAVQHDIDAVESAVFSVDAGRGEAGRIYQLKRELMEFRRAVVPLDRPMQTLATRPVPTVDAGTQPYFRDVAGRLARLNEQLVSFDSLLDTVLQAHLAQVTVGQNEDMRKITAWAAIVAVPTMVCGMYGMNFSHMPELRWTYGYPFALGLMALACYAIHRGFRRNGWL